HGRSEGHESEGEDGRGERTLQASFDHRAGGAITAPPPKKPRAWRGSLDRSYTLLSCRNLFVVADAAGDVPHSRDEAHLRHRRFVRTRPWKHVADLADLAFRLLPRVKEFLAV